MYSITPASTPTRRKRPLRDVSNSHKDHVQLPPTPTKTPSPKNNKKLKLDVESASISCKRKLVFTPTPKKETKQDEIDLPTTPSPSPSTRPSKSISVPRSRSRSNIRTSIYSQCKNLFQRGYNGQGENGSVLVGREAEASFLNNFIQQSIASNQASSLYISGPPGTGKTAQVSLSLRQFQHLPNVKIANINCMTLSTPESIYHELYCSLVDDQVNSSVATTPRKKKTYDNLLSLLNHQVQTDKIEHVQIMVLILDELEALLTRSQQVLYSLFSIANANSKVPTRIKVVLVGISNTLDLNNKFLPKLFHNDLIPESLQFLPYSAAQIKSIIQSRLEPLDDSLFHPAALQFCCQKAASLSGDLRKAFDICYKSIELVEREQQQQQKENRESDVEVAKAKVMISHIAKVCTESFQNDKSIAELNLFQKAILCQLFNCQVEFKFRDVTINQFFDFYQRQGQVNKILGGVKYGDFLEILTALESNNCIVLGGAKATMRNSTSKKRVANDGGMKCVKLNVEYDEIAKAIEGIELLKKVLKKRTTVAERLSAL
ncbi:uncharacterized protein LODBEIA_P13480 [Lodderomyces beijingensis]|uniref:Cell division control protein n=1 Tax=Lodderomyces beijingensis TaxID=1775926 RepID=A0ABP0ZG37_9ASCO